MQVVMELQGFTNSADERKSILQVICQLLRVNWRSSLDETLENGTVPFCALCFKTMTEIIIQREKLFQIETEIRDKLRKIEESLTTNWDESGYSYEKEDSDEAAATPSTTDEDDSRIYFQRQVIEEIWNKQLMQQKILELNQTSNNFAVELTPSLVQLHLEKNVFNNDKCTNQHKLMNITPCQESVPTNLSKFPEVGPLDINDNKAEKIFSAFLEGRSLSPEFGSVDDLEQFRLISTYPVRCSDSENDDASPRKKSKNEVTMVKPSTSKNEPSFSCVKKSVRKTTYSRSKKQKAKKRILLRSNTKHTDRKNDETASPSTRSTSRTVDLPGRSNNEFRSRMFLEPDYEDDADWNWIDDEDDLISDSEFSSEGSEESSDDTPINFDNKIISDEKSQDDQGNDKEPTTELTLTIPEMCKKHIFKPKYSEGSNKVDKSTPISFALELEQAEATFVAKDKTTWSTQPPNQNRRVREYEILREVGGLVGPSKNTNLTPVEIFKLMMPASIVETIVKYTNTNALHTKKPHHNWYPTTVEEIYAFMGILLYLGVEKKRSIPTDEFWASDDRYSIPFVVGTMSRERFKKIQTYLKFDSTVSHKDSVEQSKISKVSAYKKHSYVSKILDPFVEVMQSHLRPYDTLVVDEMFVRFRDYSKFRIYMKTLPGNKYGFKFWAVCDVETGYILKISLSHEKIGERISEELGKSVVLDLVQKYFNTGRAVTLDNHFTSKSLGEELIKQKMSMLGTLGKHKMDVIPEFTEHKGREMQSSIFAFQGDFTMVSYIQKKNQAAVLLSTEHHLPVISPNSKRKPIMILDYNATKSGVDAADLMIATYSCQRSSSSRWPLKIFYALVDIAALNAYCVYKMHCSLDKRNTQISRRIFLRTVSEKLMEPVIEKRVDKYSNSNCSVLGSIRRALSRLGYEERLKTKQPVSDDGQVPGVSQPRTPVKVEPTCHQRSNGSDEEFELESDDVLSDSSEESGTDDSEWNDDVPFFHDIDQPLDTEVINPKEDESGGFTGKDKRTHWCKTPPKRTKTRAKDILRQRPGVKGAANNADLTPTEMFKLLFPTNLIDIILRYTNAHAISKSPAWIPVSAVELYAFIGIILLAGVEKRKAEPMKELWNLSEKYLFAPVIATMSRDRFEQIRRFIRFDGKEARGTSQAANHPLPRLSLISEIFDLFVIGLRDFYTPAESLTIDEMLVRFQREATFKVRPKQRKYGMKIFSIVDNESGYILGLKIYDGKKSTVEHIRGKQIVMDLVEPYFNTGRGVTCDNFFTSFALAQELLQKNTTIVGTIHGNRVEIPRDFVITKNREPQSSLFGFHDKVTLVSYIPKGKRNVILLSTQHHDTKVDTGNKKKPEILLHYNETNGGVDTANQMIATYSCQRGTRKWTFKILSALLDVAALNSYRLYGILHPDTLQGAAPRRDFIRNLCEGLMNPIIKQRASLDTAFRFPNVIKIAMTKMGHTPKPAPKQVADSSLKQSRCQFCPPPAKKRKVSRKKCTGCGKWICDSHKSTIYHCSECKYVLVTFGETVPENAVQIGGQEQVINIKLEISEDDVEDKKLFT